MTVAGGEGGAGRLPLLQPGDRAVVVQPGSSLATADALEAGVAVLRSWGLLVDGHDQPLRQWRGFAGEDEQRLADFQPSPPPAGGRCLWACARGGWGAARLLERGWQPVAGWLLGFSDSTSLLWRQQGSGAPGAIHGPLLTTLAREPRWSQQRLQQLLFRGTADPLRGQCLHGGSSTGPLLVGNLTVATHLLGTPCLPRLQGAVAVFEDVGEAPYRIDRMLTHWRLCGALQQLAGLAFGRFHEPAAKGVGGDQQRPATDRERALQEVLAERTADLGVPVLCGVPVGHGPGNAALPLGRVAHLDGERGCLQLL